MLEESNSSKQYVVTNVFTAWEISNNIKDVQASLRQDGTEFILKQKCFDTLYSVLVNFSSVDGEIQRHSWDLMVKAMGKLVSEVGHIIDGDLTGSSKAKWLNIIKMTTFIACKLIDAMENKYNNTSDILVTGKGRKKPPKDTDQGHWEEDRNNMLVHLYTLIQYPLQRLWEPPVVEDDFVILIGDSCYKMLESPNMALVRTKDTRTSMFQIIGTLVKKFNHGMACSLKILQLLRTYEHMVSPAAQGVILLIQTFGDKYVLPEIIKEISRVSRDDMVKDTSGLRNFTQFLVEVSNNCPQMIVPSLSLLITFLDEEVYSLRSCVLSIMGSVVLNLLKGDNLDPKSKDLRDQCLEHLEDHIHDVHALMRSKVLQIWNDLIREKAVPLSRQHDVLKLVLGRLWDKSSLVRKNAIQLLTAFVNSNPFAAKLPLEELESQCALELKKLQELSPNIDIDSLGKEEACADENTSPRAAWIAIVPDVIKAVQEVLEDSMECDEEEDTLDEEIDLSNAVKEVAEALSSNKLYRAVKLLQEVFEKFSGAEVLNYNPEEHSSKTFEAVAEEDLTEKDINFLVVLERIFLSAKEMEKAESPPEEKDEMTDETNEKNEELKSEINKQKMLVAYFKDSVKFAKLIQQGLPIMCQLLGSKHVSDVMEAISFFVTAFEFGVLDAMTGVRKMLMLVWSKEQEVKAAVVEAYRRLYINSDNHNERTQALQIVENLSSLIVGATMGERTSLEEIVSQFVSSGDITKQCITLLWERFTKTLPDTTDEEAHTALIILAMCANAEQSIILSNFDVLTASGLGEQGEQDFALVKETCHALLRVAVVKPKTDAPTAPNRLDRDHEIFKRLSKILIQGLTNLKDRQYSPMALKAVSVIYALAEHPDLICEEVIQEMYQILENPSQDEGSPPDNTSDNNFSVPAGVLTRFCVVLGHVAVCQLVHLDIYVFSELKRRNNLKEEMEVEKKRKKTRKSKKSSASDVSKGSQETDLDEEMGLVGAVADDTEAEYIRYVCETEIINSDNLLGTIKPMIWTLCTNPGKYKNTELQAASSLTLAKYMMVSSKVCEENLQLLFTILERSNEDVVRANLVIALGDLYFRFPNELEPWTPRFYARLRDSSSKVRQNTLTVLTHLVLNDMVKVKRHISDIAYCICDEDPHISGLAGLFFHELAKKGNTLYNVLPDMISRLSDPDVGVKEESFRRIIGEVLALIQKDKHWENLVEKLCHRFQATINVRQWRDIAYCLAQLEFNEKCIKKLSENFVCYADKLHEPEVYDLFMEIISNVQKIIKPEVKSVVEELEKRIVDSHEKGVEDENIARKAGNAKLKTTNSKTVRKSATSRRGKKSKSGSSESESEDEDTRQQLHPVHRSKKENLRQSSRVSHSNTTNVQQCSNDSEENEEEEKELPSDTSEEKENSKPSPRHPLIVSNSQPSRRSKRSHNQRKSWLQS